MLSIHPEGGQGPPTDYFWDFVTYVYPTVPFAESALGISFVKGAVAGVLGACVSQPLDVLLTKVAKNNENLSLVQAAGQVWEARPGVAGGACRHMGLGWWGALTGGSD